MDTATTQVAQALAFAQARHGDKYVSGMQRSADGRYDLGAVLIAVGGLERGRAAMVAYVSQPTFDSLAGETVIRRMLAQVGL